VYDLFLSYTSPDRPWAARLYADLMRRFPTLKIFWDRESIPPGDQYRVVLERALLESSHVVVFWSDAAKASNEVGPEIESFLFQRRQPPPPDVAARRLFYIPLQGKNGRIEDDEKIQGFVDLRTANLYDRGTAALDDEPYLSEWRRMVQRIGEAVRSQDTLQPVNLAIVAMNTSNVDYIDGMLDVRLPREPTLRELLNELGLQLPQIKNRYGETAAGWRAFGDAPMPTIAEYMDELRLEINRELAVQGLAKYRFTWVGGHGFDLVEQATTIGDGALFRGLLADLARGPCVVVVDPVSLFNIAVLNTFNELITYTQNEQWVILSLYPAQTPPAFTRFYESLRGRGKAVLDGYFLPQIPSKGAFARCGVNVQDPWEARRLIRGSLGQFYLSREKNPLPSGA
jgi:hypothetical protein